MDMPQLGDSMPGLQPDGGADENQDMGMPDMNDDMGEMDTDMNEPEESEGASEIMDIVNGLPLEGQTAVKKYAKSLKDESSGNDDEEDDEMPDNMQMEGFVRETMDSMTNSRRDRPNKRIPKEYKGIRKNPFRP